MTRLPFCKTKSDKTNLDKSSFLLLTADFKRSGVDMSMSQGSFENSPVLASCFVINLM